MLGIVGVKASFIIYQQDQNTCISARSMGDFNVQIIMENLGGGGHLTMAATQMKNSPQEAKNKLIEAIDEYIKNNIQKG